MSKTEQYKPRPYFNPKHLAEQEAEAQEKNPNNTDDSGREGQSDTQNSIEDSATSNSEATYEKRWKDLKKHYDTEVSNLRRQLKDMEERAASPSFTPPKTPEELEAFREQNPEFYDVMLSVAYDQANGLTEKSSSRIRELEAKLEEAQQEKALKEIEKAHPDYVALVSTEDFSNWLDEQTSAIQSWVRDNSTDPKAFIRAIDLYKLDNGLTSKGRKSSKKEDSANTFAGANSAAMEVSTKSGGVTVGESSKRIWSRDEINRMTPAEFAKHEAELDEAMLEGRVR